MATLPGAAPYSRGMRAYKGVVENGVVVLIGARLPEGTVVTVTVGEGELLRARISSALNRPKKIRVKLRPMPGLSIERVSADLIRVDPNRADPEQADLRRADLERHLPELV